MFQSTQELANYNLLIYWN